MKDDSRAQAVREMLKDHPDKGPKELTELLRSRGITISNNYVSVVKTSLKKKRKGQRVIREVISVTSLGNQPTLSLALDFIREAGGLDQAKECLVLCEEIKSLAD